MYVCVIVNAQCIPVQTNEEKKRKVERRSERKEREE
jgi:hypothetical protein